MKTNKKQQDRWNSVHPLSLKILRTGIVILLAACIVYSGLCIFGAVAAMRIPRRPLTASPVSVGLQYEDVSFYSRGDGVILKGWFLPASGMSVIMIVNGGFETRVDPLSDTLQISRALVENGYNVLLFDLRGRGESAGTGRSMSNIFHDLGGAVDYLEQRGYPAGRIGIMGFCSGAAAACIFAAEDNVGAVILDGCFTSVYDMVIKQAELRHIPEFITRFFFSGVQTAARVFYDYEVVNPIDKISEITCPIFFIHEENDNLILTEDNYRLFERATNPASELWEIPGTDHSRGYRTDPVRYAVKLVDFLNPALGAISRE